MADVPGVEKGGVKVSVDGNTLTITVPDTPAATAETPAASPDSEAAPEAIPKVAAEGPVFHRRERGKFAARTVTLPEGADMTAIDAQMNAGTLTVTVAKREEVVNAKRDVPVS